MLGRTKQRISDENLINSDEILRSVTHRAAYRAMIAMRWMLIPGMIVLGYVIDDEIWNAVGLTLFAIFFLNALFFEVILAYDGVFKGLDELRQNIVIDRRTIIRRALMRGLESAVFFGVISTLTDVDNSTFDNVLEGAIFGVIMGCAYLYKWRHIVDRKGR